MNEKQRERPENINHGATYVNGRLSIPSHPEIRAARGGGREERETESGSVERGVRRDERNIKWEVSAALRTDGGMEGGKGYLRLN